MSFAEKPKTLTRKDLSEAIYKSVPSISRRDASRLLDAFFVEMIETLAKGEDVKLRGFGVFRLQHKKERLGRNPKTGKDAVITSRRVVKFSAGASVKAHVNGETIPDMIEDE